MIVAYYTYFNIDSCFILFSMYGWIYVYLSTSIIPSLSSNLCPPLSSFILHLFPFLSSISFPLFPRSVSPSIHHLFSCLTSISFPLFFDLFPSLSSISFPLYFDIYLFISIKVSRSLSMTHEEMNKNSTWCNFYSKFIVTFSLVSNFLLLIWLCFLFAIISSQKTYLFLLFMFHCTLCLILWVKIEATSINHFSIYPTPFFSSHSFHLCIYWIFSLFSNSYIFKIDC